MKTIQLTEQEIIDLADLVKGFLDDEPRKLGSFMRPDLYDKVKSHYEGILKKLNQ